MTMETCLAKKTISFRALQRCRSTLQDFAQTYMPLHGLDPAEGLFKYLDVLVFVEATIYQMDEENEAVCEAAAAAAAASASTAGDAHMPDAVQPATSTAAVATVAAPATAPAEAAATDRMIEGYNVLLEALTQQGLLTPRIQAELDAGLRYWAAERRLCSMMAEQRLGYHGGSTSSGSSSSSDSSSDSSNLGHHSERDSGSDDSKAQSSGSSSSSSNGLQPCTLTLDDVLATHEDKSFDYRVLHLLLQSLMGAPADARLDAFTRVDEMLIDIGDDLTDYEDDVMVNSFNIYRCFVRLYGKEAPTRLAARISALEAERNSLLADLPERTRQHVLQRQRDAVEEEGGDRWTFPEPIEDEAAWRADVAAAEAEAPAAAPPRQ